MPGGVVLAVSLETMAVRGASAAFVRVGEYNAAPWLLPPASALRMMIFPLIS